ncbi:Predicted transcriptional regulator [Streptococcus suis 05ZYH33]|nr:Predicted transcriptional regulator [Streptococcus suis 05ZYH33]
MPAISWFSWLWKEKKKNRPVLALQAVSGLILSLSEIFCPKLKEAGLVEVARGIGGARLAQGPDQITLLHVYQAVELFGEKGQLFAFHEQPNPSCQVGRKYSSSAR